MPQEEIHIGCLIKNKLKQEGRSASWLAKKIHCNRTNVYKIFEKPSIDTVLLQRIASALKTDLFIYLSEYQQNLIKEADGKDSKSNEK